MWTRDWQSADSVRGTRPRAVPRARGRRPGLRVGRPSASNARPAFDLEARRVPDQREAATQRAFTARRGRTWRPRRPPRGRGRSYLMILALPLGGVTVLRLYESALVRQT